MSFGEKVLWFWFFVLLVSLVITINAWDSERSKRIELEVEIARRDSIVDSSELWNTTLDSSVVNAADFGVPAGATIDPIRYLINSPFDSSRRTIYLGNPIDWLNAARKRKADSSEVTDNQEDRPMD